MHSDRVLIYRLRSRQRGAVLVWVGICMLALIGFVGLTVDWGSTTWTGYKLQNAADAAALAGAQKVYDSDALARNAAIALAAANEAGGKAVALDRNDASNDPKGEIVVGHYDHASRKFLVTQINRNAVCIRARRTQGGHGGVPLYFGPIFGRNTIDAWRWAVAVATSGPTTAAVLALDPTDQKSFYLHGSPILDLNFGTVQVDSNDSRQAGVIQGGTNTVLIAGMVNLVGGNDLIGQPDVDQTTFNPNSDYMADPLSTLPPPSIGSPMTPKDQITGSQANWSPGYYPKGLDLKSGDNVTLAPGVYVLEGGRSRPAFNINGSATMNAQGVMFYIKTGDVQINGTGNLFMTPPTAGTYQGIQFFQARDNTKAASFNGDGLMSGSATDTLMGIGTLYFPSALLQVGGNGEAYVNRLVANKIEVYGNGTKKVTEGYTPLGGREHVFLVE